MPKYIKSLLTKLQFSPKKHPQYSPHHHDPVIFGKKGTQQMAQQQTTEPSLPKEKIKYFQSLHTISECVQIQIT